MIHDTELADFQWGISTMLLRSAEVLFNEDGQARLIRRAEKPEDYLRHSTALTLKISDCLI